MTDENSTNASSSRSVVSSCSSSAASAFGRSTASSRRGVSSSTTPSSSTPARWNTAPSGRSAGMAATIRVRSARSVVSQAANSTVAPAPVSSAASSCAPGAASPRRLSSSRCRAPCRVTRCRASRRPRPPVPPVTSTVRPARAGVAPPPIGASPTARTRRGASRTPSSPTASCGSCRPAAAKEATRLGSGASASPVPLPGGRSARRKRPGCSDCAERTRPHTAPAQGSAPRAPWVRNSRRASEYRSSAIQARTASSARPTASRPSGSDSATTAGTGSSPGSAASAWTDVTPLVSAGRPSPAAGTTTGTQSTRYGVVGRPAPVAGCASAGRSASSSADRTVRPPGSTAVSRRPDQWARRVVAPVACSSTPVQENGSSGRSPGASGRPTRGCRAASRRAGCTPKPTAASWPVSGSTSSAYRSSP